MRDNLVAAFDDGRVENRLRGVTLNVFKEKAKRKVASRLSGGVDMSYDKRADFDKWLVETLNGVLPEIKQMPDMTIEDSKNRANKLIDYMNENRYRKGRG